MIKHNEQIQAKTMQELFEQALEVPAPMRDAFLDRKCGADLEMKAKVLRLLQLDEQNDEFLEFLPIENLSPLIEPADSLSDHTIDRYEVLEVIGQGGMGIVYRARQVEPVERDVAIKVIRRGFDARSYKRRFENERQALAMLNHPNLTTILDGGLTPQGDAYFVMEYVDGDAITQYCAERKLGFRSRLSIFVEVCDAIHHAHQQCIIHRDIKPTNLLVTEREGKPHPKVIDFGIAKCTNSSKRLDGGTFVTECGELIGTPQYMSPEQAQWSDQGLDLRTDVYSLGVLLYELLTGVTPVTQDEIAKSGPLRALQLICDQEIEPPSKRIAGRLDEPELDATLGMEGSKLVKAYQRDIDWIVLKALAKDREQRYQSVASLKNDVKNYLAGNPVEAAAPSFTYRLGKLVNKYRMQFVTLATSLVIIGCIMTLAIYQYSQLNLARAEVSQAQQLRAAQDRIRRSEQAFESAIKTYFDRLKNNRMPFHDLSIHAFPDSIPYRKMYEDFDEFMTEHDFFLFATNLGLGDLVRGIKGKTVLPVFQDMSYVNRVGQSKVEFDRSELELIEFCNTLINEQIRLLAEDDPIIANSYDMLGQFYLLRNHIEESMACFRASIRILRKANMSTRLEYSNELMSFAVELKKNEGKFDPQAMIHDNLDFVERSTRGSDRVGSAMSLVKLNYAQRYSIDEVVATPSLDSASVPIFQLPFPIPDDAESMSDEQLREYINDQLEVPKEIADDPEFQLFQEAMLKSMVLSIKEPPNDHESISPDFPWMTKVLASPNQSDAVVPATYETRNRQERD